MKNSEYIDENCSLSGDKEQFEDPHTENVDVEKIISRISVSSEIKNSGETMREDIFHKLDRKINVARHRAYLIKVSAVAASIFILLGITGYLSFQKGYNQNNHLVEMLTPKGVITNIYLPDSTKAILNGGTSLKYPIRFKGAARQVEIDGEAFFDVSHNEKIPFIVKTQNINIQVHGTEFNVKSYDEDKNIEITLNKGSVSVKTDQQESIYMKPNEQLVIDKTTNQSNKYQVDTDIFLSWKERKFYFRNRTMEEITNDLERAFDVNIVITSDQLKTIRFTGDFTHGENLEQILQIITMDHRTRYVISNKNIYINDNQKQ